MSRFDVVQPTSYDRRISHPLQSIPCGRCYAVIEYDRGAVWRVVSELVNEHWKACPGKPHARPGGMTRTLTSPPDTAILLPSPVTSKQRSISNPATESTSPPNHAWTSPGCERKRRTLEQRKMELEQDEYAKNVTTKSVVCGGCHKEISLDKRSKYYPGLWLKHRGKCPGIEKLERAKVKVPQGLNGTREAPCHLVLPAFGDNVYGSVVQSSPAERYENHSAAATDRLVRQYDSEYASSEDEEDDDRDVPPQEPFPTQNIDFYLAERLSNQAEVWTYRYATKDEINTNLFHGQNEPYARQSGHALTHFSPQMEEQSPRCVIHDRVEQAREG